ncbi:hypothetical protein STEG23_026955 [Scotinomys teguina]
MTFTVTLLAQQISQETVDIQRTVESLSPWVGKVQISDASTRTPSQRMTLRLSYVEPSLHLWDKAYLVMVDNVFDVFLELVCQYFIEYFCIYVHEGDRLIISLHLFLLGDFASSSSRAFSFNLVDLSIGWNLPSSAFCKAGFVDRYCSNLVLSWNVLFTPSMVIESFARSICSMTSVRPFICRLSFDLVDLSIGWNPPSSAFCRVGFVDRVTGCSWVLGIDSSSEGDWLLLHLKK